MPSHLLSLKLFIYFAPNSFEILIFIKKFFPKWQKSELLKISVEKSLTTFTKLAIIATVTLTRSKTAKK